MSGIRALGVVASPFGTSRTRALVQAVLRGASATGEASSELLVLSDEIAAADGTRAEDQTGETRHALLQIEAAEIVVFGMPVYRAAMPGMLKNLLDLIPRGTYDGAAQPLCAKPVAVVATGASDHHFLALDGLAEILRGFFAAYVVPPGIYASHAQFDADRQLSPELADAAETTGRALVALQRAIAYSPALAAVAPQV